MRFPFGAALTGAFLLLAAVSPAQSLSDAAAKEKARRKSVTKPTRVVTDEELRTGGSSANYSGGEPAAPSPSPSPGGDKAAAKKDEAKKEKTEDELRAEAQAEWRKRLDAANQEAATARQRADQIQAALNDTSGGVFTPRRASLGTQLEEAQKAAAAADQKVASITDEGRRQGWR